ncbi:hypothetical protein [Flavivirga algicola]|uniref:Lipoprotein n=1 Tax=Flavivirga algicola TaxID=2729136 RepID=A0ABX1RY71_9FLAO|nr:hypothetical protein [Flavivirga algicola]NMH87618.1 hypothetical protein [Flavivirga algicola]
MKKILAILLLTAIVACNSGNKTKNETQEDTVSSTKTETKNEPKKDETPTVKTKTSTNSDSDIISKFLTDISTLEKVENKNPISLFQELAEDKASKVMAVSKDNIKDILSSAKEHSNCVITTGDHTIVKIIDINNCKQSGTWGACMPFAKGYIKKGELIVQEDYINNIIGIPDTQVRKAYFFN